MLDSGMNLITFSVHLGWSSEGDLLVSNDQVGAHIVHGETGCLC